MEEHSQLFDYQPHIVMNEGTKTLLEDSLFPGLLGDTMENSSTPEEDWSPLSPTASGLSRYASVERGSPEQSAESIVLLHKPRGSKGIWHAVQSGDKLRVTKGKGKRLRLECPVSQPLDLKHVTISLMDLDRKLPFRALEHFSIEGSKVEQNILEVDLKLFTACKRLQFTIEMQHPIRQTLGRSVEFGTHNSGGAMKDAVRPKMEPLQPILLPSDTPEPKQEMKYSPPIQLSSHQTSSRLDPPPSIAWNPPSIENYGFSRHTSELRADKKRKYDECEGPSSSPETMIFDGSLDVRGTVRARAFSQLSDLRLKTDVADIVDAIKIVSSLQGKTYRWKNGENHGNRVIGLIAQEVQQVLPEVVSVDESGILSVSYSEILPVLIEAFKELLDKQKQDKEDMQGQIDDIKGKLDSIMVELDKRELGTTDTQAGASVEQLLESLSQFSQKLCEEKQLEARKPVLLKTRSAPYHSRWLSLVFVFTLVASLVVVAIGCMLVFGEPSTNGNNTSQNSASGNNPGSNGLDGKGHKTTTNNENNHNNIYSIPGIALMCAGATGFVVSLAGLAWSCKYRSRPTYTVVTNSKLNG